jgi:hypothetical protein
LNPRTGHDLLFGGAGVLALAWLALGGASQPAFGSVANILQVLLLTLAASGAWRSATLLGDGSPARPGWLLLALSLAAFGAAEAQDAWHEVVRRTARPFPSPADAFFLAGYLLLGPALLAFIRVYRASGFAVGGTGQHAAIALGVLALAGLAGWDTVHTLAVSAAPLGERVLGVAYVALDFLTLVLTFVLLRIAAAFRGGHVWRVWALLLTGLVFTCAADLVFAFLNAGGLSVPRTVMEALYLLSYLALARGVLCEHELLAA